MKYLFTYSFLCLYLLVSFRAITPFLAYSVNKAYIIKEYCVNKAKPEMHCDGKCYLKKQEKREAEKEKIPVSQAKDEHSVAPHLVEADMADFHINIFQENRYNHFSVYSYSSSIDIPTPPPKS